MDGAHAAACEDMAATVSSIEGTAQNGLILCIETVMAEVYTLREFSYLNIILFWLNTLYLMHAFLQKADTYIFLRN